MRSEFLDFKWRALLAELDLSYRQRDGSTDLPFEIDHNITMCDWRNSFSDGSKMYSFPVPWPIKPAHASEFYLANTDAHMAEHTGAISGSSWGHNNYAAFTENRFTSPETFPGITEIQGGIGIPTEDDVRKNFIEPAWIEIAHQRLGDGEPLPLGMRPCRTVPKGAAFSLDTHYQCTDPTKLCDSDEWCTWSRWRNDQAFADKPKSGCRLTPLPLEIPAIVLRIGSCHFHALWRTFLYVRFERVLPCVQCD
jgi:hypothetical protein